MARRPNATLLRENKDAPPPTDGATVIDAKYDVVGPKKRGWLGKLWMALVAIFVAAAVGFLIPPLWIVLREVFARS